MKYIEIRSDLKKLGTLAVLGAIVAPTFMSTAQARPKDDAPAWGYRKNKKDKARNATINGVITRDYSGDQHFQMRGDNGVTYEVNFARDVSDRVTVGDRVSVTGDVRGEDIFASRIRILRDSTTNTNGNSRNEVVTGVITRDYSGDQHFQLRGDNGRTYEVNFARDVSSRVTVGDRVRIVGDVRGGDIFANSIQILRDTNNGNNDGTTNRNVTLNGVITRAFDSNERFQFRGDNGRVYEVNFARDVSSRVTVGDRVRIVGDVRGNDIFASRVEILRDANNGGSTGRTITLDGVVTRDYENERLFQVRADNGRTYVVRASHNEPGALSDGDRVRLVGEVRGTDFYASSVRILSNNGGYGNGDNENGNYDNDDSRNNGNNGYNGGYDGNVSFIGTVVRMESRRHFDVRANNGRTYVVSSPTDISTNVSVGDRVRIHGDAAGNGGIRLYRIGIINDSGRNNNGSNNGGSNGSVQSVNFTGVVTERVPLAGTIRVRADNGRTYYVRVNRPGDFRVNQRVRVVGRWNGSQVVDASVRAQ